MKVLSALLLTFIFILTGCGDTSSETDLSVDTSRYLKVSVPSTSSNAPVGIEQYVTLTFSAPIDETTVNASSVYITDENKVPVPSDLTVSKEKISIVPNEFFIYDHQYTIVVTTAVEDIEGRTIENTFTFAFLTSSIPDTTAPSLTSVTPADGTSANKATDIIMTFDENIAGSGELQLKDSDSNTIINGTSTISGNTLHFVPNSDLIPGANYTVILQGNVEDLAGNAYVGITSWDFSVTPLVDATAPSLVSVTPADGTSADKATDIVMAFDEEIAGSGTLHLKDSDSNAIISGTVTMSANQLTFVPNSDLTPGANYTVTLQNNVTDLVGNAYEGITSWDFSVNPLLDTIAPTLISLTPADGTSADKGTDVIMAFSEEITNSGAELKLKNSDTNAVVHGTSIVNNNKMHFIPSNDLVPGANYTVTVLGPVTDLAGNTYTGITSWDFSVNPLVDTTVPSLVSVTPADGTSADKATDIIMAFDEEIAGNATLQLTESDSNAVISGTSTMSANQLGFVPDSDLTPGINYTVTLQNTVEDLAGNAYTGITSWDFSVTPLVDTTAPTLVSLTPADGTSADKTTDIIMAFSEEITGDGVLELKERDSNMIISGTPTMTANQLDFVPDSDLTPGINYTVTLQNTVEDLAGNAYTGITSWDFSVTPLVDTTAPTLVSLTPADGTSADKTTDIIMAFSEEITGDGVLELKERDSNMIISGTPTMTANQLDFVPDSDLTPGINYTVTLQNTVEDLAGNAYTGITSWDFSVTPLLDTTAPTLVSVTPADGTSADKATDIVMAFSEEIAGNGELQLIDSDSNAIISGTVTVSTNQLGFVPDSDLTPGANYTVTLQNTVEDLAGNAYEGITSWDFSITPLLDTTAPTLVSLTPADGTSADKATDIVMAFDEEIVNGGVELKLKNSDIHSVVSGTSMTSNNTLRFIPDSDLTPGDSYTVTQLGPVRDLAGNTYTGITSWDFSVTPLVDVTAPTLVSVTPADGTSADKATDIVMAFDEEIAGNGELQLIDSDSNTAISGTSTISANQIAFVPDSDLTPGANYTVTLQNTVEDLAGNAYAGISSWDFSVTPLAEAMLTIVSIKNIDERITIEFYEKLDVATVSASDFLINGGDISFNGFELKNNHVVKFIADSTLIGDETITVSGTIKDILGNSHNGGTEADYSLTGIFSVWYVKYSGEKITITFWEKLDESTVTASDFLINEGAICFSGFVVKSNYEVEFTADTPLNGDELITISGDIKNIDGNIHNYGVSVTHGFR